MDLETIERQLITYLAGAIGPRAAGIERGTPLISGGLLDSFAVVDLVEHVESTFAIRLEPDDMAAEKLDTVARLGALVLKLREATGKP